MDDTTSTTPEVVVSSRSASKTLLGWWMWGGLAIAGLAVAAGLVYAAAYTETKIPLVSAATRKAVTMFAYRLPFLPKTARQILTAVAENNKTLTSYTADFSFSGKVGGVAVSAGSADLKLEGPLDFSDPREPKFDISAKANVNFAGTNLNMGGRARGVKGIVYFKVDDVPVGTIESLLSSFFGVGLSSWGSTSGPSFPSLTSEEMAASLKPVWENWIEYDTRGLPTEARQALEAKSQNQSFIDSGRRKIQNILLDKSVMPEVKLVGREKIDGVDTYHLQVNPSKEAMKRVISEFAPGESGGRDYSGEMIDSFISATDAVAVDAWFGVTDSLPRKISIQMIVDVGRGWGMGSGLSGMSTPMGIMGVMGSTNLNLSMVLGLKDIGRPAEISIPYPAISASEYWNKITEATVSPGQKEWNEKSERFRDDFRKISQGLLKYWVDNGEYPGSLGQVFGTEYSGYKYRRTKSGVGYAVYVETGIEDSPYYGVTSTSSYPHILSQRDFE